MADLKLHIVTPERIAWTGTCGGVNLPAWNGEIGVLPGHAREVLLVRGGLTAVHGTDDRFVVGRGFAEVGPDQVTILVDTCEAAGTYDRATASRDLATADTAILTHADGTEARRAAEAAREVAIARLG